MEKYMLQAQDIIKIYNSEKILWNFNIHVPKGSIYGLVGENGAGKTTFLQIVTGLLEQNRGELELLGEREPIKLQKARKKIGYVSSSPQFYLDKDAVTNLRINKIMKGIHSDVAITEVIKKVGLGTVAKKSLQHYSAEMIQRLAIAKALLAEPEVLLLDEPWLYLDSMDIMEIKDLLLYLNRDCGITILISSSMFREVSRVATHYGIIKNGEMQDEFSLEEFKKGRGESCLEIKTKQVERAIKLLQETFHAKIVASYNSTIILTDFPEDYEEISLALAQKGIGLSYFSKREEPLEDYYIRKIKGRMFYA